MTHNVAIVGVAESDLGVTPGLTAADLMAQAAHRALEEAGLKLSDVDGLFTASAFYNMPTTTLAEYLGVRPRYSDSTNVGGASFVSHLRSAALAIEAGLCEVALITYGSNQRSAGGFVTASTPVRHEAMYDPLYPISMYALAARRHMHEYGTTPEQLAEVAVAARRWAMLNPKAYKREPLTIDDVLNSRMISSPLRKLDCCLVTDGGGAVVMTSAARARDLKKRPVYILGHGAVDSHRHIAQMPDLTVTGAAESGRRAFAEAGITPADVDFAQLYDAFTINVILFLEDLGFCEKGEGGAFVEGGRIAPGGQLPVNTSGGGLSYCHPGMFGIFLVIEAVRQLRGEGGQRQVPEARVGLVHANGGTLSSQVTTILGTDA